MSDDEELGNLDLAILEARQAYLRHRDHLRLVIGEGRGPDSGMEPLMALAEEFGADFAMERFGSAPERLGFDAATPLRAGMARDRLADVLTEVTNANYELGWLVGSRENILCERDPARARIYNIDGREAVLDVPAQKVRFLDAPDQENELTVVVVEPSAEPTREFIQTLNRERRRERRRER